MGSREKWLYFSYTRSLHPRRASAGDARPWPGVQGGAGGPTLGAGTSGSRVAWGGGRGRWKRPFDFPILRQLPELTLRVNVAQRRKSHDTPQAF